MQNVPKIVRERLKAATPVASHPDADVLTAFAERSLPELERAFVLDHLARCGDCRDVVALALPATETVEVRTVPARVEWLTWPTLRWGLVAAGVVTIAAFGVLQYQRRAEPAAILAKRSPGNEVIATKAQTQPPPMSAGPAEQREKTARAFASPVDSTNANPSEPKQMARHTAPQAFGGAGAVGGTLPHGPKVPTQWQQNANQQNAFHGQAFTLAAPRPALKQPARDLSANVRVPSASETAVVESGTARINTQIQDQEAPLGVQPGEDSSSKVGKAKPLVSPAPRAESAINHQPGEDQAARSLRIQASPGQLGGYVVDPSGAVVPNARITIIPSNTGATTTAVTNSQGAWLVAGLPTGNYKAQAEAQGFKTTVLDLNYDAHQPSLYSFTLSPGSVSETVEVSTAQVSQVQAESAAIGGPITKSEAGNPRLNGRNFTQLVALTPGTVPRWTISSAGVLQRSFDQGNTWQAVDVNANPATSANLPSLEIVAKNSRAKEKDADKKTLKREAGTVVFRAVAATGSDVWAGGSTGALYHSLDAGKHWTRVVPSLEGTTLSGDIVTLEFSDSQHGKITSSASEVWTTSDDGQTWQKQ